MESMELIYIAIAAIAIGIACFVYLYCFRGNKEIPEEPVDAEDPSKPVSGVPVTSETLDQKYARAHNMWICMYCETMNLYPKGVSPKADRFEPVRSIPETSPSELRGDLLNKASSNRRKSADTSDSLVCIACGKRQKR